MADVSTPLCASPANRNKKVVLLGLGSKSSLDVNKSLFDWANVNIVDEEDDVYVMHFTRKKKTGMSAIRTASTQRAGVTVVDIAAVAAKEDDSVRPKVPPEWCPDSVIDAMNKRRSACHTCAASVFEVDLDAGFVDRKQAGRVARRGRSETVSWFFFRRRRVREKRENDADKKLPFRKNDRSASPRYPAASTPRTPPACPRPWWSRLRTSSASGLEARSS
jgi:hypothetical protein